MKHENNGHCEKCEEIMQVYPSFHADLWTWFQTLQKKHPEAHVSCCGRGREEQEKAFLAKTTKAHYGQSSHNYNAALDLFRLLGYNTNYDSKWFIDVIGGAIVNNNSNPNHKVELTWYGWPHSSFKELPHVEVTGWRDLDLKLVERE